MNKMRRSIRRSLLALSLLAATLCSCSRPEPSAQQLTSKPAAGARSNAGAGAQNAPVSNDATGASDSSEKTPATGTPRAHPFLPEVDVAAGASNLIAQMGTLTLKAVISDSRATAIIQERDRFHVVAEGDLIGSLTVVSIEETEVVLSGPDSKVILSLYDQ